jgi:hypothetical protein
VSEPHIRNCVEHIRATFANAKIRTYIPILVARQARAALSDCAPTGEGARVGRAVPGSSSLPSAQADLPTLNAKGDADRG